MSTESNQTLAPPGIVLGGDIKDGSSQGSAGWESSPYWQQQFQLVALSRESSAPHNYARTAARASKNSSLGPNGVPQSAGPSGHPTTVAELAMDLVKQTKQRIAAAAQQQNGGTPSRPSARSTNPQEKKDQLEEERQRHINENIHKQFWTAIDLSGQGLLSVSPRLFDYRFLQKLFLNHNNLSAVPLAVTKMPQLRILDLSHNYITHLPPEIGLMVSLKYLFLFDNDIKTIPTELGSLFQLELLGIEGNPIEERLRNIFAKEGTRGLVIDLRDSASAGEPPRPRQWLELDDAKDTDPGFSVFSYNTLCDRYATPQLYGYTPSWALAWEYRANLLVEEVLAHSSDVIALQEVNMATYQDVWLPKLTPRGYKSIFYPKTRARTMASEEERNIVDGCVTFYKTEKVRLIQQYQIEYNSKALQKDDLKRSVDIFNRVMTRDNVALIGAFEYIETGQPFVVANTHLHWDPAYNDVKLVQSAILLEEIEKIAAAFASNTTAEGSKYPQITDLKQLPITICGDFNSTADSGVYQLFSQSQVPPNHPDFEEYSYGNFTEAGMEHKLSLKSAYADGQELPFTNYTPNFVEAIDYIWYSTPTLQVTKILGPVDPDYAQHYVGFPNPHHPSDHVPVGASIKFHKKKSKSDQ